jgi:hypothetical protein
MKKLFFLLSLFVLVHTQTEISYAGGGIAGATEPTQWLNNFELVGVNISDAGTFIQQSMSTMKQTILDPIATGLIAVAQKEATDSIISWANGGFSGTPLIISNPESFIKGAGLTSVKATLSHIPLPGESVLGDSIFNTIVNNNKEISIATQLATLSKSPTASVIRKAACDDADTLLERAKSEGGTSADISARYAALNSAICDGDISDPVVASNIDTLAKQDSSLGGWDLWLSTTGGYNEATNIQKSSLIAANDKVTKQGLANQGIFQGEGAISQKQCLVYVKDDDGNDTAECEFDTTLNPGKAVQDAVSKSALAPLDRLSNLTGADGLNGILSGFITNAITTGLNTAFKSVTSGGSNTNSGTVIQATAPVVRDLVGNPEAKKTITAPILKQLAATQTSLNNLLTLDNQFLSEMTSYESRITAGRNCYVTLKNDFPSVSITQALAFYTERQGRVDAIKNVINPEKVKIAEAQTLITSTQARVDAVTSTKEVSTLYNEYSTQVEQGGYPTVQTEGARRIQYQQAKSDADRDSDMTNYQNSCATIRQQQSWNNWGNNN